MYSDGVKDGYIEFPHVGENFAAGKLESALGAPSIKVSVVSKLILLVMMIITRTPMSRLASRRFFSRHPKRLSFLAKEKRIRESLSSSLDRIQTTVQSMSGNGSILTKLGLVLKLGQR